RAWPNLSTCITQCSEFTSALRRISHLLAFLHHINAQGADRPMGRSAVEAIREGKRLRYTAVCLNSPKSKLSVVDLPRSLWAPASSRSTPLATITSLLRRPKRSRRVYWDEACAICCATAST